MNEYINDAVSVVRQHGYDICLAWTAALLVVYGGNLSKFAKNIAKSWHFVFRVLSFIVICGFGYGMLTIFLAKLFHQQLMRLDNIWLLVTVIFAFFFIGFLAEKKNQI